MSWTDERVELLRKLWSEGLSAARIANQLGGVTRSSVLGKLYRLRLSKRGRSTATPARKKKPAQALRVSKSVATTALQAQFDAEPVVRHYIRPTEDVVVPVSQHLQLVELTERTCKWPNGDPLSEDFNFCGNDAVEGKLGTSNTDIPYCKYHCRIAFQPAQERRYTR